MKGRTLLSSHGKSIHLLASWISDLLASKMNFIILISSHFHEGDNQWDEAVYKQKFISRRRSALCAFILCYRWGNNCIVEKTLWNTFLERENRSSVFAVVQKAWICFKRELLGKNIWMLLLCIILAYSREERVNFVKQWIQLWRSRFVPLQGLCCVLIIVTQHNL